MQEAISADSNDGYVLVVLVSTGQMFGETVDPATDYLNPALAVSP